MGIPKLRFKLSEIIILPIIPYMKTEERAWKIPYNLANGSLQKSLCLHNLLASNAI